MRIVANGASIVDLLGAGIARELTPRIRPPAGLVAIALSCSGWAAPMPDDDLDEVERPSLHPMRRRVAVTTVVGERHAGSDDDEPTEVWSYVRVADEEPKLLDGGIGYVHDQLVRCWERRRDAHGVPIRRARSA